MYAASQSIRRMLRVGLTVAVTLSCCSLAGAFFVREWKSGILWKEPPVIEPGPVGGPPSDAIILFNGTDMSAWEGGEDWIVADGAVTASKRGIVSKQAFGDCQLHVEFATPSEVKGSGQGRGNSGIFLMNRYELQVLDSYQNITYFDGQCGAIYKQQPPIANACRKPGEWQTYDVLFTAPRFNSDGSLHSPAYITVLHNGVLIQNHLEIKGSTSYTQPPQYSRHSDREPISIQFHGDPVRFRNIWVRENVKPIAGEQLGGVTDAPPVPEDR